MTGPGLRLGIDFECLIGNTEDGLRIPSSGTLLHCIPCGWVDLSRTEEDLTFQMRSFSDDVRVSLIRVLVVLLVLVLSGCEFQSSITPIVWPTVGPQPFLQATLGPQPSPVPLAPTPVPPPPVFEGADSLDCAEPQSGDNHFGYCRIPGTNQFYAWGECAATCPEGNFPGIEIMTVTESETFRNFQAVVDIRGQQYSQREEGLIIGGGLGVLGIGGGVVGVIETCIVSSAISLGWGCAAVLLTVGVDLAISAWQFDRGLEANTRLNEPLGLEDSSQDLFEMLHNDGF